MVVFWVALWPLLFTIVDGVRNIDRSLFKSALSMGAKGWRLVILVVTPLMVPYFFTGLRTAATLAFFMIIGSEMVGAKDGLGWLFMVANHAYNLPLMYGVILVITLLAIAINVLFTAIEHRFQAWRPAAQLEQ